MIGFKLFFLKLFLFYIISYLFLFIYLS